VAHLRRAQDLRKLAGTPDLLRLFLAEDCSTFRRRVKHGFYLMKNCLLALLGFCSVVTASAASQIIYDNTSNYLANYNDTTLENGDQVKFSGASRVIDYFSFEYFTVLSDKPSGNETARVRFYLNDATLGGTPFATPGTLLYDSGPFSIAAGYRTVEVSDLNVYVPSDSITWTVQFSGLTAAEHAGLLFYDPPTVGSSEDFFWQKEAIGWTALAYESGGSPSEKLTNNFNARFTALEAFEIRSLEVSSNTATLRVSATAGKYYSLEHKSNADQTNWMPAKISSVRATGNEVILTDSTLNGALFRIYRVVERDTATVL
jgi:hypothetical protein